MTGLVLVPMPVVGDVAMTIVDVIGVVAVGHGLVTAAFAMDVVVGVVGGVGFRGALVPVAVVLSMGVAVVEVVGVVAVHDCDVPAAIAVGVVVAVVAVVAVVGICGHG